MDPHLDPAPFIVPPVLTKTHLQEHPVVRLVWSRAFKELDAADNVVFVGYSLPPTDAAAGSLFGEALLGRTQCIQVVNLGENGEAKLEVMDSYKVTFPAISPDQFVWSGAHEWAAELVASDVE